MPAQDDLGRGPLVARGDGRDHGVGEEVAALADGAPRLGDDAALGVVGAHGLARHPGVQLDLVDVRGHAGGVDDPLGVLGLEVGQAHGAHQPGLHQVDQALEGVDVAVAPRVGPVDQEQVDLVNPEPLGAHVERVTGLAPAVPFGVELGGHEQLVAGRAARAHPAAHASLVSVGVGGVDEPVAEPDRLGHDPLGLAIAHGPRPQPEVGHPGSVRQLERRSGGRHASSVS